MKAVSVWVCENRGPTRWAIVCACLQGGRCDGSLTLDASALEQGATLSRRLAAQQIPQQQGHRRDGRDPTALLPQGLVLLHPSVERRDCH